MIEYLNSIAMMGVGLILVYLAVVKEYEPLLLLPIGFGTILANIPNANLTGPGSMLGGPSSFVFGCRRSEPSASCATQAHSGVRWLIRNAVSSAVPGTVLRSRRPVFAGIPNCC